ncbi:MAG: hypothetical protein ABII88_10985 [Candidatus Omnitrophota bacterium]
MKKIIIKSILIAMLISIAVALVVDIRVLRGISTDFDKEKLKEIEEMPYKEAMSIIAENSKPVIGIHSIFHNANKLYYWQSKMEPFLIIFICVLSGCLIMGKTKKD